MQEYETKIERLHRLMREKNVQAVWLTNNANIAWLSGGNRTYIDTTSESGIASLLITADRSYLLTNNVESQRLIQEEGFSDWEIIEHVWYEPQDQLPLVVVGRRVATDQARAGLVDVRAELVRLRAPLTEAEVVRYRAIGREAGLALGSAARAVLPGMSEYEAAGLVASECEGIGAVPAVVLVASDERFKTFRHPLPTAKRIEKVVMLVVCARKHGLFANLTRVVSFGPLEGELKRRAAHVTQIEAEIAAATLPGASLAAIFDLVKHAYADKGFEGEWRNHHQGGACSYGSRDYVAGPGSAEVVRPPQAFAWNPSVSGAKAEDTILVTEVGVEVLTPSPEWPALTFEVGGQKLNLAGVLEI